MKQFLFVLIAVSYLALPARVQADEGAIRQVISDQITAFLADDVDTAFGFSSPTIRSIFGSSENFGTMVRGGFPMVWRPQDVTFLKAEVIDGQLWQAVMMRDAKGVLHILDYQMVTIEGDWKINAVHLRKAPAGAV